MEVATLARIAETNIKRTNSEGNFVAIRSDLSRPVLDTVMRSVRTNASKVAHISLAIKTKLGRQRNLFNCAFDKITCIKVSEDF